MLSFGGNNLKIFNQVLQPVVSFDPYGTINFINRAAARRFPKLEVGCNIEDDFKSLMWTSVYSRLSEGFPISFSATAFNGEQFYLSLLPMGTEDEFLGGICSINEQLSMLSDPGLAGFLHDLKNPLLTANSSLDLIATIQDNEKRQLYFEIARRNIKTALQLLKNANHNINLADPENYKFKKLNLSDMLREICEDFRSSWFDDERANVELMLPEIDIATCCDGVKIKKVVYNLLDNAKKHGTGKIRLPLSGTKELLRVEVRSGGEPLEPNILSVLTLPFYSSDPEHGTGLGLYIVNKVILAHGGKLYCTPVEDGNIFGFTLPLNEGLELKSFAARYFINMGDAAQLSSSQV